MSFQPIKSICVNIFSGNIKKIENEVKQIIGHCKILRQEITKSTSINYTKSLVQEHMYVINYCYKCMCIVKLISNLKNNDYNELDKYDKEIEAYINNFFLDRETYILFSKLLRVAKEKDNKDEIYFYENILDKCPDSKKGGDIEKKIKEVQDAIQTELNKGENIIIPKDLKKYFKTNDSDSVIIDRKMYYNLLQEISDPNIRKRIEEIYFSKSEKCLELLENLIVLRSEYAKKNNYSTYFEYIKRKDKLDPQIITNLINDLIKKVIGRSNKEIKRIEKKLSNDGYKKKVEIPDFIYYYEELCSKYTFTLKESLKVLFNLIKKYFGLEFKECTTYGENLWNTNIKTYQIYNDDELLGYLHLDILYDKNKKISSPICIHMCHNYYDINNNINYDTNVAILANFVNNEMTHSGFVSLSKEVGKAIQFLLYKTTTGNMSYRDNYYQLTSKVIEHFAWEKSTLMKLCKKNSKLVDHLLFTKFIDLGVSINLKCIDAHFDFILHNNKELIDDLQNYIKKNGKLNGEIFKNIYRKIYKNTFSSQKDIFNSDINLMHPVVIFNEINGSESTVYENIILEILSYNVFNLIKNKEGKKYKKIIANAGSTSFKNLLNKFIRGLGDNYNLYLQEIIGYNEIDTELNIQIKNENSVHSSSNCFIDTATENLGDQENVFTIDRKLDYNQKN